MGSCTACPDNSSSDAGSSACTCDPGYYGDGVVDGTACTQCPADSSSTSGAQVETDCTCSVENAVVFEGTCTCDTNYYGDGSATCTLCPNNEASTIGENADADACECIPN